MRVLEPRPWSLSVPWPAGGPSEEGRRPEVRESCHRASVRPLEKASLRDELARVLAADLAVRESAHRAAVLGATHEEAKPENDKDTRALEQSYLARGEAQRVEELRLALAEVRTLPVTPPAGRADDGLGPACALGSLVTVEEGEETRVLWVAPHGGGARLAGGRVQVVTPRSPLGRAVLGKRAGDECEVVVAGRTRHVLVARVE